MSETEVQTRKNAKIDAALLAIKSEITAVAKGANNPFFNSSYADLNTCLKMVEPLLKKNGCYLTQPVMADVRTGKNVLITKIVHADSGETVDSSVFLSDNIDPQKLGGEITYHRRYTLKSLLGMQDEDDDGNIATGRKVKKNTSTVSKGDF